jgi:ElaB/YqjD/DUF883 family membrane-anchored ribosome-binding protein
MSNAVTTSREKLAHDLHVALNDAEELVRATAQETGERVKAVRARLQENLQVAKARVIELQHNAAEKAKAAAAATDRYAHENPWKTAGIAAGIGLLIGVLIGRKI